MDLSGHTVIDNNGHLVGYGINRNRDCVEAFVRACNTEDWPGRDAAALPYRVVRCDAHGTPIAA